MPVSDKSTRPEIDIEPTPLHHVLSTLGLAAILFSIWIIAGAWGSLPERIFTHFDMAGKPDGTGPKSMIVVLPVMGLLMWVGLGLVARHPRMFNYAVPITAENAGFQYENAVNLMQWVRFGATSVFAYLGWASVQATLSEGSLPFGSAPMYLGLMVTAAVVVGLVRSIRGR